MTAASDQFDLDWHRDWVTSHAQERAAATYIEMLGVPASFDENGLLIGEKRGLAGVVHFGMDGIEEPAFVERAQLVAIEIYLRRLHDLLSTSSAAGSA